jgi:hypothetical protein
MGALEDGTKELIVMFDGERESEQSWLALLIDAKGRGLVESPKLATGDGALGFWKAIKQVYPATGHQRCWVHKTVSVLDKLPRCQQVSAKNILHEIWMSATKADAIKAMEKFAETYHAKHPKAVECLLKGKEELLLFYDFPAEHWQHLRTSGAHSGEPCRRQSTIRRPLDKRSRWAGYWRFDRLPTDSLAFGGVDNNVPNSLALPRVGDMNQTIGGLNNGGVRQLRTVGVFDCHRIVPSLAIGGERDRKRMAICT